MAKVLVACEFSGRVREAFREQGHDAWSCDIIDTEIPGNHIIGDVRDILNDGWDIMVAHPPCTYLAYSGVAWLYAGGKGTVRNEERWANMAEAAQFFKTLLEAPIPKIAIENPIIHGHAQRIIGVKYDQIIQPWMFGHGETKATCLWLKNLPVLMVTLVSTGREGKVQAHGQSKNRAKNRSRTYPGIAKAMAQQWG